MILLLVAGYGIACWKWGAWRRWRDFYSTILYVIIGDLAYQFAFNDFRLWTYTGLLGHIYTAFIIMFLVFPSAVILYLGHFPSGFFKRVLYITVWAMGNTLIEKFACMTKGLRYEHGWSILSSFALFVIAFLLIRLHVKKPLLTWLLSLACGVACTIIFALPPHS